MQYMRIFREKGDEFDRYWASISTEIPGTDGKGTGEYARASIPVRLSEKAKETFKKFKIKSKTDGITHMNAKVIEFWLKAVRVEDEDGDAKDILICFINKIEAVPSEEDD